ncbi:T6SS effector BTH_I2691 family protein [Dyella acidiphila]|uniref:Toxin VasX N-terminal region domain-containing protein n=1 Tax=Dyella acidiphila TaxID=2775866 RepID=A0ABR9GAP0_9GAMM|nr:T6SS effector BTH_I2691 family protein [Dyella acidiphila]MBE1161105.1 hypothetical protein [Dyella acidiphila]
MADGQGYSGNAQAAAATSPSCTPGKCAACEKAGLPVLLVRPGAADNQYAKTQQTVIAPLLKKVATPSLAQSGYVMRTLRDGYVYAYYQHPPTAQIKAQKGWQVFRVSTGGYLQPYSIAGLPVPGSKQDVEFACKRADGYANAMVFVIPNAKQAGKVWVGFSDNPWSDKVRDNYAASESLRDQRMACIDAPGAKCDHSLPLNEKNIGTAIADFDAKHAAQAFKGNPYPPLAKRNESPRNIVAAAASIAKAGKQFTPEQSLIVSVPDPVGVTTELAQRRLTLCNSAGEWLAAQKDTKGKPDGAWKLQSALTIQGLLKIADQQGVVRNQANAKQASLNGKPISADQFAAQQSAGKLPQDATFEPDVVGSMPDGGPIYDSSHGTIRLSSAAEIKSDVDSFKQKVLDRLKGDGKDYQNFLNTFNQKAKNDTDRVKAFDADYGKWLNGDRKLVTDHDFDDSNHADGVAYAQVVSNVTLGGPKSEDSLAWFKNFLTSDPKDKNNLLVRAMLGNQQSFFQWITTSDQHAKTNDMVKTVFDLKPVQGVLGKGEPVAKIIASAYAHPIMAVIGATMAGLASKQELDTKVREVVKKLSQAVMGKTEDVPVALVKVTMPFREAVKAWTASLNEVKRVTKQADKQVKSLILAGAIELNVAGMPGLAEKMVDVYCWTKETPDKVAEAAKGTSDKLRYALRPAEENLNQAWKATTKFLDDAGVTSFFRNAGATLKNGDAMLSVGAGVLQLVVINEAMETFKTGTPEEREGAAYSLASAALGVATAAFEIGKTAAKALGKTAAKELLERVAGSFNALATAIDATSAGIAAFHEYQDSNKAASTAHAIQAMAFGGAAIIGAVTTFGVFGAEGATVLAGLSLTGWGLILVALGVIAGFVAVMLQDTPTQKWAAKTIWGSASEGWGSLEREQTEINAILINIKVTFNVDMNLLHDAYELSPLGAISHLTSAAGDLFTGKMPGQDAQAQLTHDALLHIELPESIADKVGWSYAIYGKQTSGGEVLLAQHGKRVPVAAVDNRVSGTQLQSMSVKQPEKSESTAAKVTTIEQRITLVDSSFSSARAEIKIYDDPQDTLPIVDESLQ